MAVIEQEADIIHRDPDQAGLQAVLDAAADRAAVEVEIVVAQVELEGAGAALLAADRAPDRGAVPAPAAIAATLAGQEIADLGISAEEIGAEPRNHRVGLEPMGFGRGVERPADQRRLETQSGLAVDAERRGGEEAHVGGVEQGPLPVARAGAGDVAG